MNEQNEIKGDAIESIEAELLADAPEGETGFPEDYEPLPDSWTNAPLSAILARELAGGDPDLFDRIKADLKGE